MNWDDTKILLAIGRTGGLSRTAKFLGVSVSTVHRRAAELEHALNAKIFARRADGYTLTDVGRRFFALAEKAEEHLAAMERQDSQGEQDVFRIAAPELVGQQLLLPRLSKFQAEHPKLRLEISTSVVPVEFHRREADIVVRFIRPESGRYTVRRLGCMRFGLFCNHEYFEAAAEISTETDLHDQRLIGWDRNLQYVFLAQRMHELTDGTPPALSFDSLYSQLVCAQAGHGIALLHDFAANAAGLVRVLPQVSYEQDLWLMRHCDTENSPYSGEICSAIEGVLQNKSK
ncbi:LysR family transcriptional regulator [Vreelandella venusta]